MKKLVYVFFSFMILIGVFACSSVSDQKENELTPGPVDSNLEDSADIEPEPVPIEPEPIQPEPTPIQPEPTPEPGYPIQDGLILMTLAQLSQYDGREGRNAYIAVNGYIYDVTNSSRWPNGSHNGYQAGQDLTNVILTLSPHGLRVLDNIPKIGILVE